MVLTSLDAFVQRDEKLARQVLASDDGVDLLRNKITKQMIEMMKSDSALVQRALDQILIARRLERIADHATNIAEDVIFLVKGVDVRHGAIAVEA
jgi:phosphate transport system protein